MISRSRDHDEQVLCDAIGTVHRAWRGAARIVSLVPSLTELVCELGLAGQLVGRTGFCIHPRDALRSVTKVGGTKDVKVDVIRALAPTHLIVNIDENRRETVDELATFVPNVIVTHPCVPEDNLALYRLFGALFDRRERGEALALELQRALADADALRMGIEPESVLYLIWRDPWMTVSRSTYISAMLARVGWHSLPEASDVRYPVIDWNEPWLKRLGRVLLSSEPYRFRARHVEEVVGLCGAPVELIDGEMASWYGSRAIAGIRYLTDLRARLA
ncbi:helical backbone metal receptor [Rhodocyclaceae bacterium SMB388]